MAEAYSAQMYQIAEDAAIRLWVFPNNPADGLRRGQIAVRPFPKRAARGWRYFAEECRYGAALGTLCRRLNGDTLVVATGLHPLGYAAAAMRARRLVVSRHNTFWTRGTSEPRGWRRLLLTLGMRLAEPHVAGILCVSEEIRRQFLRLCPRLSDRVVVHVPQYELCQYRASPPPTSCPRRILFAGRLETNKGIDDVLDAAKLLQSEAEGAFEWRIAGQGSQSHALRRRVEQEQLEGYVCVLGQLDRDQLLQEIHGAFLTLTPTRADFAEGLAKLPLEGALIGRPAIVSTAVPALDLLGEAAEPVAPGAPREIAAAVKRLSESEELYRHRAAATSVIRAKTSDPTLSFRELLRQAVIAADATQSS